MFITTQTGARYMEQHQPCDIIQVGEPFGMNSYGFALPHNHPLEDVFNQAILELQETGELEALEKKWWYDKGECGKTWRQGTYREPSLQVSL